MATPSEKLAESLEILRDLQVNQHIVAIKVSSISRTHRERLIKNHFLKEVTKGYYIATNPNELPGDSTSWYTSFWQFCAQYLADKYGDQYCISAEQSIFIHAGNNTVPQQLLVRAQNASNTVVNLIHETSIFALHSPLPNLAEMTTLNGIRSVTLPSALIHCSSGTFKSHPTEMRTALAQVTDASEILKHLLDGSHSVIAGRLAGAFRNNGQAQIADEITETMKAADYKIRELDPFEGELPVPLSFRERSPYANRIKLLWNTMRQVVLDVFPKSIGLPNDAESYLKEVDQLYITDAYHSLSIERYTVSAELIELVRSGDWDSTHNPAHRKQRDAMAARGYHQATIAVKETIKRILDGEHAGEALEQDHSKWYRELFAPSVTSGILKASDLAGYRTDQVYISQSKHVPLSKEAIRDAMPVLFDMLKNEKDAGVRAVLGHFIFVYIHPYMDGNGRMGRFLMNVMLASGGYPWTVIPVESREEYMRSLEIASVDGDIKPFAKFIAYLVERSIAGNPVARQIV